MRRGGRDYWVEQLSEYWDSGLTIQEYGELKELPYESLRRWIRLLKTESRSPLAEPLELVEVSVTVSGTSGVSLKAGGVEICLEKGFDGTTLLELLNLLGETPCSSSAVR